MLFFNKSLSPTQSNHAYWGGDSLSPQRTTMQVAPIRHFALDVLSISVAKNLCFICAARPTFGSVAQRPVQSSPTQSNPVQPSRLGWRQLVATTFPPPDAPTPTKTSAIPFVIRHFALCVQKSASIRRCKPCNTIDYTPKG